MTFNLGRHNLFDSLNKEDSYF